MSKSDLFGHVPPYPGDPILSLMEDFQTDPREDKVSLSIGLYFDEQGRLPVLESVRRAEAEIAQQVRPCHYLPMAGLADYRAAVQSLVFGPAHEAVTGQRIATIQTLGGSGALKVGADFIKRFFPDAGVWVSDPTWENHIALFDGAGLAVKTYPYYRNGQLAFEEMLTTLRGLPRGSVVLLHGCCHNPTGVDLSQAQWRDVIAVLLDGGLIPFFDLAYQGFGDGLDDDAWSVRAMVDAGLQLFVANSFSKNFSLYGERCGGLSVVCRDATAAQAVLGQLMATVRRNYSSPPAHGSLIIAKVLSQPVLRLLWTNELDAMRLRMQDARKHLHAALQVRVGDAHDVAYLLSQRGMFSYTGLSATQVDRLREGHGIYLVRSGRLCVTGLTRPNTERVADALATVMQEA